MSKKKKRGRDGGAPEPGYALPTPPPEKRPPEPPPSKGMTIDAILAQLREYERRGFDLILTSHYTPEDLKDAQTKIDYLERLKSIAASCQDSAAFKAAVQKQFPAYSGENYLDMTAGFFFP